jgi:ubiquinone/menaquinone biosynthesis C-methylase UbiE
MGNIDNKLKKSYTRGAARYDERRFVNEIGQSYQTMANNVIKGIILENLPPIALDKIRILDVATGTGRAALGLARHGFKVIASDITEQMIRYGVAKREQNGLQNLISFVVANARYLPFKQSCFDGAVSIRFFHLLPPAEQDAFIKEITRVVKPGNIIIIEYNNRFAGFVWSYLADFYRHEFLGKEAKIFLWPHQMNQKFRNLTVIKKCGIWLPGTGKIMRVSKMLARLLNKITQFPPFCYFTNQILIVARV